MKLQNKVVVTIILMMVLWNCSSKKNELKLDTMEINKTLFEAVYNEDKNVTISLVNFITVYLIKWCNHKKSDIF